MVALGARIGNINGCYFNTIYIPIPCLIINLCILFSAIGILIDLLVDVITPKITSVKQIKIDVKKYTHPRHEKVGITIYNKEKKDIEIYINLITPIRQSYRKPNIFGWTKDDIVITYGKANTLFDLGLNSIVKADYPEAFVLAEIQNNEIAFLLGGKPLVANLRVLPNIETPTYKIYETKWDLEFEIRGNIKGDNFVKQTYKTEIFSTRTIPIPKPNGEIDSNYDKAAIEIGDVTRVK